MRKIVWAEATGGKVIRIFRSQKLAFAGCEDPQAMYKDEAVGSVRRQVFDRQEEKCLACGKQVYWDGSIFQRAHLDEIISKGRGGEVSLANCQILCFNCHVGPDGKHSDRRPRFGEGIQ